MLDKEKRVDLYKSLPVSSEYIINLKVTDLTKDALTKKLYREMSDNDLDVYSKLENLGLNFDEIVYMLKNEEQIVSKMEDENKIMDNSDIRVLILISDLQKSISFIENEFNLLLDICYLEVNKMLNIDKIITTNIYNLIFSNNYREISRTKIDFILHDLDCFLEENKNRGL